MESELYSKWYKCICENEYSHDIAQIVAVLVSYEAGEMTLSESVKEKLIQLNIMNKDGKIIIEDLPNYSRWLRIASELHTHKLKR
jgi:hypothetical protein